MVRRVFSFLAAILLLSFALPAGWPAVRADAPPPTETSTPTPNVEPTAPPAPPATPTPTLGPEPTAPPEPTAAPAVTEAPTPTRRPPPIITPTRILPHRVYLPLVFVSHLQADDFWADRYQVAPGECAALYWSITNAVAIFLDGVAVPGQGARQVCPSATTTYLLRVERARVTVEYRLTIVVAAPAHPSVEFWADAYHIRPGECTNLRWRATGAQAVFLNHQGVPGEGSMVVCPIADAPYVLDVEFESGATATWRLLIRVGN